MPAAIADQVVEFFDDLFTHIFSDTFRPQITNELRRKAVVRQVEESADAASQSLTRFFRNQQLTEKQAANILAGFALLPGLLKLANLSDPNVTSEFVVEELLAQHLPIPKAVQKDKQESVFRVALHSIVQVLMLVGPVMAEWQKLTFSSTFELPRRVLNRLNQISEQLDVLGSSQQAAADERFELSYRDYLLQRFHRVEAGTVRMTTNLDVDLRELFVMPRVLPQQVAGKKGSTELSDETALMNLASARKFFGGRNESEYLPEEAKTKKKSGVTALEQIKTAPRIVIVGAPGSGKSTFFEWLQLKLAAVEEELEMAGKQAIPLLLRVRQLDPHNLPKGAAMIEKATASRDRAALMPLGWLDRQMKNGRILLMLDGLDETEPELRDGYILPWLQELCRQYPHCRYLVSSRPVGYPVGALHELKFVECDLRDFGKEEIAEYTRHWCTAIRLARNEPEEEARREGKADGEQIVSAFKNHPDISNLARHPLLLSAICLVYYFEGGLLPRDRSTLYRLCIEGLLHYWDQRRGVRSEFTLEEKLRACGRVALAMQAEKRIEYEAVRVLRIFAEALDDSTRAEKLLEHIRNRAGLLVERRPGIFAFIHRVFQEYLAATEADIVYQWRESYPVWAKQVQESLYEANSVDMAAFPQIHRDFIWEHFRKDKDFLSLTFNFETSTLAVSERARLELFRKLWAKAKEALEANEIQAFRKAADSITKLLCETLVFKRLEDSATLGQLYGRMIDASSPAFQLNVRPQFPVIYACKTSFSETDIYNAFGLLSKFQIASDYFALIVVFENYEMLRQSVRQSVNKNDFIVLHYDLLWEILAAQSPLQHLTDCILDQIDLVAVSPYKVGGPVPEKMFFGRAEEEKTLLQNISRNDYALLANRQVGKTSLLNNLAPALNHISRYQVFYFDLQAVNDYEGFYKELAMTHQEFYNEIDKLDMSSPLDISSVIINIKSHNNKRQIILIFDEVDELLTYDLQFKEQLFKTFRRLSQRENVRFVFSGTTTLVERVRHPDSPFFNFCEVMKIGLLDEKAARELVMAPMRTLRVTFENEDAIVQHILTLSARHPNMIQYTCDRLIKRINEKRQRTITKADLDTVVTSQEFYEYFEQLIWGQSSAREKLIVYLMWPYPKFTKAEVLAEFKRQGIAANGVEASLETLRIYSILSRKASTYFFTFREFMKLLEENSNIGELVESYREEVLKHGNL